MYLSIKPFLTLVLGIILYFHVIDIVIIDSQYEDLYYMYVGRL